MKVLHTPVNYASLPTHSVRCLRMVGVDARGLIFSSKTTNTAEGMETIYDLSGVFWRRLWNRIRWIIAFIRCLLIFRPDIIHWYSGKPALPLGLDLLLVRLLRIPRLVEWQGTDIRIPEIEFADNPYYAAVYEANYENRGKESEVISRNRQRRFAKAGFACAAPVGMLQYVQKDLFPEVHIVPQRMVMADYAPIYPNRDKQIPLVVHSPSARGIKGTEYVLKAVERVQANHPLDFQLLYGLARKDALQLMAEADIVLDQFVLGDRGMVALEAMAMGKPVICYVKPSLAALYPESPIINATPETLPEMLEMLVRDAQLRHELGEQGRAYMEKYYDLATITNELLRVYDQVMKHF
ncbi:MAG: hypothetical protein IAE89_16330 [Anaerolineae bacterium]|nr:hypothetical protein [Anaerolineae bacterium]